MAEIGTETVSIEELFSRNKKLFRIPQYQRSYAWEDKQREDLWNDIEEGLVNETQHYLGTIILQKTGPTKKDALEKEYHEYEVVDGQQRITSLSLLILALHETIKDERLKNDLWEAFIRNGDGIERLKLGRTNNKFYKQLEAAVQNNQGIPESESLTNRRIEKTFNYFRDKLEVKDDEFLRRMSGYIRNKMKILEFVTDDKTLAIKTFQTVNDRGKDLTLLDKTKSFLMFYLTKYDVGNDDLMEKVERKFGKVFGAYDEVNELGHQYNIAYITEKRQKFTEDNFLQYFYHYFFKFAKRKYELESLEYEYNISAENVFQRFIKNACRELKDNPHQLKEFIETVVDTLTEVGNSLARILAKIEDNEKMDKLMRWQQPNAYIYPLLIAAEAENILDNQMIELIRVLDMRIYKIRNTDPRAKLYRNSIAQIKSRGDTKVIKETIRDFIERWGKDEELDGHLRGSIYSRGNRGEKIVLWEYAKQFKREEDQWDYELFETLELEHILADEAQEEVDLRDCGFDDEEEFNAFVDKFGNLALLEKDLNKKASNKPPSVKAEDIYKESEIRATRLLGNKIVENGLFNRSGIEQRTNQIIQVVNSEWSIPPLSSDHTRRAASIT